MSAEWGASGRRIEQRGAGMGGDRRVEEGLLRGEGPSRSDAPSTVCAVVTLETKYLPLSATPPTKQFYGATAHIPIEHRK